MVFFPRVIFVMQYLEHYDSKELDLLRIYVTFIMDFPTYGFALQV